MLQMMVRQRFVLSKHQPVQSSHTLTLNISQSPAFDKVLERIVGGVFLYFGRYSQISGEILLGITHAFEMERAR